MAISPLRAISRTRRSGIALAGLTALVSGVAVFLNGHGVRAWAGVADAATYTTAKNMVAAAILGVAFVVSARKDGQRITRPSRRQWARLAVIALIGGSLPFLLFFEGLGRATSRDAAFIHKTLVIWVTLLAIATLRERIGVLHVAALVLLVGGQAALGGGIGDIRAGSGEGLMLLATLLWSVEVVVAKPLLDELPPRTVAMARMGGGALVLVAWGLVAGGLTSLTGLGAEHLAWVALTGATLSVYVRSWYAALARAPAVDVTAILVGGAIVTAMLDTGLRGLPAPSIAVVGILTTGVAIVVVGGLRSEARLR